MREIVVAAPVLSSVKQQQIIDWCTETFGPGGRNKRCVWRHGWIGPYNEFFFKDERDALVFRIRWC